MKWSETVTLEFVKIYLKHECLWRPDHPGYKIKYQREKAYSDISAEFKVTTMKSISMPDVKMKIKNLRTTYMQQVHKILLKSSPDAIYKPSLVWFNEMDRCLKHIPSRHVTHSNIKPSQETSEVDSSCQIWVDQELQHTEGNPDPLVPQTEDEEYDLNGADDHISKIKYEKHSSTRYQNKVKKKKLKQRGQTRNSSLNSETVYVNEDEFDIYGKYIASQLRKMDLHKALRLQLEIQNLVSEARISDFVSSD